MKVGIKNTHTISLTLAGCAVARRVEVLLSNLGYYHESNGVDWLGRIEVGTALFTIAGRVVVTESIEEINDKIKYTKL